MKKIFLTGITGLVGSAFVVALLRERQDCEFVCLARKSAVKSARQRTEEIIRDECKFDGCPELADRILSKVSVIEGDVVDLDPVEMAKNPLLEGVNVVFHCAADVNLGQDPTGRTFRINYQGSKNIVELAKLLKGGDVMLAIGNSDVPVGQYTLKIFNYYGIDETAVADKLTYGNNVKEVTSQVSEGAVDCGIIYATDACSAGLTVVDSATAEMCGQVIYPAAVLKGDKEEATRAFLAYLQTDAAMTVFESVGFSPAI